MVDISQKLAVRVTAALPGAQTAKERAQHMSGRTAKVAEVGGLQKKLARAIAGD